MTPRFQLPFRAAPVRPPAPHTTALLALAVAALAAVPASARAQGALSVQGYGYPTGQLSTRALGAGGALGEFDAASPINPAQVSYFTRPSLSVQFDPEFRTVGLGARTDRATVARFPLIAVGLPARGGVRVGISASTLLDRSFSTSTTSTALFDGQPVTSTETLDARGAISDIRFAVGAPIRRWLRVGAAAHVMAGENRVITTRSFLDSTRFAPINDSVSVDFRGTALSAGVELIPVRGVAVSGAYRLGNGLRAMRRDSTVAEGQVPDRMSAGVRVDRVSGATFVASWTRTAWSDMNGLGTAALRASDGDELRAGVEALGPKLGDYPLFLRLGAARRDLPFGIGTQGVRESGYSGGLGLPLGGGRGLIDLAIQRVSRSLVGAAAPTAPPSGGVLDGVRERAWLLSVGLTVRP